MGDDGPSECLFSFLRKLTRVLMETEARILSRIRERIRERIRGEEMKEGHDGGVKGGRRESENS